MVIYVFIIFSALVGCNSNIGIREKIKNNLNGYTLYYTNIAGNEFNYTIQSKDITEIVETTSNNEKVWRVKVGETLSWYIYFDESGENIVKQEALFVS